MTVSLPCRLCDRSLHTIEAEMVRLRLEAGADMDFSASDDGTTAMILASSEGKAEVVRLLPDAGADSHGRNNEVFHRRGSGFMAMLPLLVHCWMLVPALTQPAMTAPLCEGMQKVLLLCWKPVPTSMAATTRVPLPWWWSC